MKSVNRQIDAEYYSEAMEAGMIRPDPLLTERVAGMHEDGFAGAANGPRAVSNARAELAEAFRRLGRGRGEVESYEQAKDFYRSSGHAWTRGLGR